MGRLHDMVVTMFQQDILTPARLEQVIRDLARTDEHGPARAAEVRRALEADLRRVEGRIVNLTEAVAAGGEVKSLIAAIRAAEGEQQDLRGRLEHADGRQKAAAAWDVSAYREQVLALLQDWQGALEAAPQIARQILRKLLASDIVVTPKQDAYGGRWFEFRAEGTFRRILYGVIGFGEVESGRVTSRWAHIVPADPIDAELAELVRAQERNADLPLGSGSVLSPSGAPGGSTSTTSSPPAVATW